MGTPQKRVLVVAGEASGDMRGAGLVSAVLQLSPQVSFLGVGGQHMAAAGVKLIADIDQLGVMGLWDVVKHLPAVKRVFDLIIKEINANRIDAAVLVDYPGFNLRLAKHLKKRGIKVIYYVSPQVWAWRENRVPRIQAVVDRMMVLFPFEKDIYAKYGMTVDYVGHPLLDEVRVSEPPASIKAQLGLKPHMPLIGLMPGSRDKEIERHLPVMLDAAKILATQNPDRRFIMIKAATISRERLQGPIEKSGLNNIILYEGPLYNGIGAMDAAIIASGTATLEAGLLLRPMVIIYKTAWLTYWVAKMVIKIPYIGLVNVVAGKRIVDEFIQADATASNIAAGIEKIFADPNTYGRVTNDLARVKSSLGASGASRRAAGVVLEELSL